jgi:hypothetical protein
MLVAQLLLIEVLFDVSASGWVDSQVNTDSQRSKLTTTIRKACRETKGNGASRYLFLDPAKSEDAQTAARAMFTWRDRHNLQVGFFKYWRI